ncbi:16S rRNA pseudouridine(516) synthase [Shewanella sp. OPT22]|nr:16S rRNA pseudouridine(516) synthase [Shewanella sp. OPT22]
MKSKRGRLDRFICKALQVSKKQVRMYLLEKRIKVNDVVADALDMQVTEFDKIQLDQQLLLEHQPIYILMNKPVGVVSATKDDLHKTVLDLIDHPDKAQLHIAGRLDLNSSGLLLLTNDSKWSSQLMSPDSKVTKKYYVKLKNPVSEDYISGFNQGFYFEYEDITTKPAKLEILSEFETLVTLSEGKYHQIKRMFGRYRNPVESLHRISVGHINLPDELKPGEWRLLKENEIDQVDNSSSK